MTVEQSTLPQHKKVHCIQMMEYYCLFKPLELDVQLRPVCSAVRFEITQKKYIFYDHLLNAFL